MIFKSIRRWMPTRPAIHGGKFLAVGSTEELRAA